MDIKRTPLFTRKTHKGRIVSPIVLLCEMQCAKREGCCAGGVCLGDGSTTVIKGSTDPDGTGNLPCRGFGVARQASRGPSRGGPVTLLGADCAWAGGGPAGAARHVWDLRGGGTGCFRWRRRRNLNQGGLDLAEAARTLEEQQGLVGGAVVGTGQGNDDGYGTDPVVTRGRRESPGPPDLRGAGAPSRPRDRPERCATDSDVRKEGTAMKTIIGSALVLCAVVCLSAAATAQTPVGALAIDERQGDQYGWAVDYETTSAARTRALSECGSGCSVVLTFERCAAYAAGPGRGQCRVRVGGVVRLGGRGASAGPGRVRLPGFGVHGSSVGLQRPRGGGRFGPRPGGTP